MMVWLALRPQCEASAIVQQHADGIVNTNVLAVGHDKMSISAEHDAVESLSTPCLSGVRQVCLPSTTGNVAAPRYAANAQRIHGVPELQLASTWSRFPAIERLKQIACGHTAAIRILRLSPQCSRVWSKEPLAAMPPHLHQ